MRWTIRISLYITIICLGAFFIKAKYFPPKKHYWVRTSEYSKSHWDIIENTIRYYEKEYGVCPNSVKIKYINKELINCGKEKALGCTAIWENNFFTPKVTIAVKNRTTCDMIETTLHELRHSCEGLPDCYDDPKCWSHKLMAQAPLICPQIQNGRNP